MTLKRTFTLLLGIAIGLCLLGGCASAPALKARQKSSLQTRTFEEVSYESVFRAFRKILMEEGYIVNSEDEQGGLIVGSLERVDPFVRAKRVLRVFGGGDSASIGGDHRKGEVFEISVNVDPADEGVVHVRMAIQKVEIYNQGERRGSVLVSEESYQSVFDKVNDEVERRREQGSV